MDVQLKVLLGNAKGQTIKITGPKFFVGRSEDCQLRPKSDLISRHHCSLILEGDYLAIRDFGSRDIETLPVITGSGNDRKLIGVLQRADVMRRYREELLRKR